MQSSNNSFRIKVSRPGSDAGIDLNNVIRSENLQYNQIALSYAQRLGFGQGQHRAATDSTPANLGSISIDWSLFNEARTYTGAVFYVVNQCPGSRDAVLSKNARSPNSKKTDQVLPIKQADANATDKVRQKENTEKQKKDVEAAKLQQAQNYAQRNAAQSPTPARKKR